MERGSKVINAATDNCCAFSTKANQNAPGELMSWSGFLWKRKNNKGVLKNYCGVKSTTIK